MKNPLSTLFFGLLLTFVLVGCESAPSQGEYDQPLSRETISSSNAGQDPGLPDDPNMPWSNSYGSYPWDDYPF